ncbi:MAG: fumarate hydratase [Negativicutes bacterium]|nr:fumarate hydratase [Negativicutes bacterium]
MREINVAEITAAIAALCMEANTDLGCDVENALRQALLREELPLARSVLQRLLENAAIARQEKMAICQDTGMAVVFADLGQDLHLTGGDFVTAVNEGVRIGYREGYLRKSVAHPLSRKNTGDNTPAVIHLRLVPGEQLSLTVAPKGFGSENMGTLSMLTPAAGIAGVRQVVLDTVRKAGGNPCPPLAVGVGIGGTMEQVTLLAKRALLREIGVFHPEAEIAHLEQELLCAINQLGIGPLGFGGKTTALQVAVEWAPTHIAGLPVAVNLNCHVARHRTRIL